MGFLKPMLAHTLDRTKPFPKGDWVAEEKLDGHRLIVEVADSGQSVTAWSRLGNKRALRNEILGSVSALPDGIYDGELIVPGQGSSAVKELVNESKTVLVLFDLLKQNGEDWTKRPWHDRRLQLELSFREFLSQMPTESVKALRLTQATACTSHEVVELLAERIWEGGGEGLVLKDTTAPYGCGKRSKAFLKYKETNSAVLTAMGFVHSEGEIQDRGPYASVVLRDSEGNLTIVKTLDDNELDELNIEGQGWEPSFEEVRLLSGKKVRMNTNHPKVGVLLRIDYQQRTPDGSYRHPRWDRWEEE